MRTLAASAIAAALLVGGCASSGPGAPGGAPGAATATAVRGRVRSDLGPPPGVDGPVLARRDGDDRAARLSLADALREIARDQRLPAGGGVAADPVDAKAADEALRHYLRGRDEILQERFLAGVTWLEKARELDPTAGPILRELAHAYTAVGNPVRAVAVYQAILALDPDDSEARFALGLAAASQRQYRLAVALLAGPDTGRPRSFTHDPAADALAEFTIHFALRQLGYDQAAIDIGLRAVRLDFALQQQTGYGQRVASLYRRRGDLWREIGDAHARLGDDRAALQAYATSAGLPVSDPIALQARAMYAHLRLGRVDLAEDALLAGLRAVPLIGDREVRLCAYLAESVSADGLGADVVQWYRERSDDPGLARAAAVFLPPDEARDLLRSFVNARPRDVGIVGQLLAWLGPRDPAAAVDLTASLVVAEPDLADAYVARLVCAVPPRDLRARLAEPAGDPGHDLVAARAAMRLWDVGGAWWVCQAGLERRPDDVGLLVLQIEIAGRLDEPALLAAACDAARDVDTVWSWVVRAAAFTEVGDDTRAVSAALTARDVADRQGELRVEARLALAGTWASRATTMPVDDERAALFRRAIEAAEEGQRLDARHEGPHAFLARLYGPGGPLADPDQFRLVAARVKRSLGGTGLADRIEAWRAVQRGAYERALELALDRCERDPTDRESLRIAVLAWERLDRADDAEQWLRERVRNGTNDPGVLDQLVRLLIGRDRTSEARAVLDDRERADGDGASLRRLRELVAQADGDRALEVELAERRLNARPEGTRRALQLALLYARVGRSADALAQLEWLVAHGDDASYDHLTGAIGLAARLDDAGPERDRLAATLVERTVTAHAPAPMAIYAAGLEALSALDDRSRFDALVRHASSDGQGAEDGSLRGVLPWRDLAQRLVDRGDVAGASRALRIRLETILGGGEPQPQTLSLLASMILAAEAARPDGAPAAIDLLVDLDARGYVPTLPLMQGRPTLAGALSDTSQLFALTGNASGSEQLLREVIRLDPSDAMAMNNLGYQRIEEGHDDAETIVMIEQAGQWASDSANVADTVGWLRYKQGRFEDDGNGPGALSLIRRAIDMGDEPSPEVLDHQGDTLWRMGKADDAVRCWRGAAELLDDSERRDRLVRNYLILQSQGWGLVVIDPEAVYDREVGSQLDRMRRKLAEVEAGRAPAVASTFEELTESP
jgi:tetratricopeptide (TPR) repeat protein